MFIRKKGHQPGVYVPLSALFLVMYKILIHLPYYESENKLFYLDTRFCVI